MNNRVLLGALRNHLVTLALVRYASTDPPPVRTPMWIHPEAGATPAPGDQLPEGLVNDAAMVTSIKVGGDIPQGTGEGMFWETTVDLRYRTAKDQQVKAMDLDEQLQRHLVGSPSLGTDYGMVEYRLDPTPGLNVRVQRSYLYGGFHSLGGNHRGGEDFLTKFGFVLYRE